MKTSEKIVIPKNFYEKNAWQQDLYVCGIDEVGRGCLAGPVVVGAVILPINTTYYLLKDSKILTEEEREKAFAWIVRHAIWSTAVVNHRIIDQRNIYQATLLAMRKVYFQIMTQLDFLEEKLKFVLIDAMPLVLEKGLIHKNLEFLHFNYGEQRSISIAAGSIVAKVVRDRLMGSIGEFFPGFAFEQHKGYATKQHMAALQKIGPSIIHRKSFLRGAKIDQDEQQLLFT